MTNTYVPSIKALAEALEVSRQSVYTWQSKYPERVPKKGKNGFCVEDWRKFMYDHALKPTEEWDSMESPVGDSSRPGDTVREWRRRQLELQCTKIEREIAKDDGKLLVASELEVALGQMLASVQHALSTFPQSCARFLVGLRDVHEVQSRLDAEMDSLLTSLGICDFFLDLTPEQEAIARTIGARMLAKLRQSDSTPVES